MADEIITNVVTEEIAKTAAEEAVTGSAVKLPNKISLNMSAVAAGAGIAIGLIGIGFGTYKLVKYIKKTVEEKKAAASEV